MLTSLSAGSPVKSSASGSSGSFLGSLPSGKSEGQVGNSFQQARPFEGSGGRYGCSHRMQEAAHLLLSSWLLLT